MQIEVFKYEYKTDADKTFRVSEDRLTREGFARTQRSMQGMTFRILEDTRWLVEESQVDFSGKFDPNR
jgi:hypothetical protein